MPQLPGNDNEPTPRAEPLIEVRPATLDDLVRMYAEGAHHVVGTVDDQPIACIGFREVDGRLWGLYCPFEPLARDLPRSVWSQLFFAFRRELQAQGKPVFVLARDEGSARLLSMLGMKPTTETYADKEVWSWTPET